MMADDTRGVSTVVSVLSARLANFHLARHWDTGYDPIFWRACKDLTCGRNPFFMALLTVASAYSRLSSSANANMTSEYDRGDNHIDLFSARSSNADAILGSPNRRAISIMGKKDTSVRSASLSNN